MEVPREARGQTDGGNVLVHGVIGGAVGVVFFFIPFSTVIGGAIAGYLENGAPRRGGKTGLVAGLVMYIPMLAIGLGFLGPLAILPPPTTLSGSVLIALWMVFGLGYTLVLGVLGGVLGAYVRTDVLDREAEAAGDPDEPDPPAGPRRIGDSIERAPNTLLNGLIGGVAGLLLSFIPLSMVLGGAIAGYLEGGSTSDGLKVGALAGIVAYVPILVIAMLLMPVFVFLGFPALIIVGLVFFVLLVVGVLYFLGLGILGGVIGVYLKAEL